MKRQYNNGIPKEHLLVHHQLVKHVRTSFTKPVSDAELNSHRRLLDSTAVLPCRDFALPSAGCVDIVLSLGHRSLVGDSGQTDGASWTKNHPRQELGLHDVSDLETLSSTPVDSEFLRLDKVRPVLSGLDVNRRQFVQEELLLDGQQPVAGDMPDISMSVGLKAGLNEDANSPVLNCDDKKVSRINRLRQRRPGITCFCSVGF